MKEAIYHLNLDVLANILQRLSPSQQADLISCMNSDGYNDVMIAAMQLLPGTLREMVGKLSPDQTYFCITSQTQHRPDPFGVGGQRIGYNALMLAVDQCLNWCALDDCDDDDCDEDYYEINDERTSLNFHDQGDDYDENNAGNNDVEPDDDEDKLNSVIAILLENLTPGQQLAAILQENWEHRNVLHITGTNSAVTIHILQYIPLEHMPECISSLESQWKGLVDAAVGVTNNGILSCILDVFGDQIDNEKVNITTYIKDIQSLNVEQIRILSPHNSRYIFTQGRESASHKYSLICYSTADREGAKEEATYVHKSFWASGFESALIQWNTFEELEDCLLSHIQSIRDDCNLLFVALLSHGYRGGLQGRDGSHGDINKLLRGITENIHSHIPLVSWLHNPFLAHTAVREKVLSPSFEVF